MNTSRIMPMNVYVIALCVALCADTSVFAESASERKDAVDLFEAQFSASGIFACGAGGVRLGLGAGVRAYAAPLPTGITKDELPSVIGIELETYPTQKTKRIESYSGIATFTNGGTKMSVKLNDGKAVVFERFGPTPEWPFRSKKDSQVFFTFRLDDGPVYQCKAVYQPDQ